MTSISDQGLRPSNWRQSLADQEAAKQLENKQGSGSAPLICLGLLGLALIIWLSWDFIAAMLGFNQCDDDWTDAPSVPGSKPNKNEPLVKNPFKGTSMQDSQFADSYNVRAPMQ
jgi:hypothetical protein